MSTKKSINIASEGNEPVFINPEEVASIEVNPADKNGILISKLDGTFEHPRKLSLGSGIEDIVKKFSDEGVSFVSLPSRFYGQQDSCPRYFSPKAVSYITTSKENDDGTRGVILGLKGVGRIENDHVGKRVWNKILKSVTSVDKKKVLEFDSSKLRSRWLNPDKLYIDPNEIVSLRAGSAGDIDFIFNGSGALDVRFSRKVSEVAQEDYAKMEKLLLDTPRGTHASYHQSLIKQAFRRATEAQEDFYHGLAKNNEKLVNISTGGLITYVDPDALSSVCSCMTKEGKPALHVVFKEDNRDYMNAYLTEEAHDKAVNSLHGKVEVKVAANQMPKPKLKLFKKDK